VEGLELLGAMDALSTQYVTLRVKNVDQQTLANKLGGTSGTFASAGLHLVNAAPRAALDVASPLIKSSLKDYGIDADISITNAPPVKGGPRAFSEFWPGLLIGGVIGGSGLVIAKLVARLFARR
jgi:hypothetical protein